MHVDQPPAVVEPTFWAAFARQTPDTPVDGRSRRGASPVTPPRLDTLPVPHNLRRRLGAGGAGWMQRCQSFVVPTMFEELQRNLTGP